MRLLLLAGAFTLVLFHAAVAQDFFTFNTSDIQQIGADHDASVVQTSGANHENRSLIEQVGNINKRLFNNLVAATSITSRSFVKPKAAAERRCLRAPKTRLVTYPR